MTIARKLFGTDGVRGEAGTFLSAELATALGRATTATLEAERPQVLIVRDTRESGPMLEAALAAGIAAAGGDALLGGVLPTPAAAILVKRLGLDLAAVVSASHNPFHDNGIKFFDSRGVKLADAVEAEIEAKMDEAPAAAHAGHVRELNGGLDDYLRELEKAFPLDLSGRKVVLDCANGATYRAAPAIFERLGAEVEAIAVEPDGRNINAGCGSTHIEALAERVAASEAEIGFAFDGDGDRVLVVDGSGRVHDGDELIALAALGMARRGELHGGVVVTVMSNFGFHQAMKEAGVEVAVTQVGDRYVIDEMQPPRLVAGRRAVRAHHRLRLRLHRRRDRGGADDDARARRRPARGRGADAQASPGPGQRRGRRPRGDPGCHRCLGGGRARGRGPRRPRPGPAAPLGDRAPGAGDGRGAERRGSRRRLRATGGPRAPRARLSGPSAPADYPYSPSMCGIVGYVGARPCEELLLSGLEKLEYRGYDSAGLSVLADGEVESVHAVGNLANLRAAVDARADNGAGPLPPSATGIAHTRWATHGRVTEENAHPHDDSSGQVHIVLNGIVENHSELRRRLQDEGQVFTSETDAEVVAHLIAAHYDGDLAAAVRAAYAELRGHYAFVAMHADEPQRLIGARKECPLVAGVGEGETFLASAIPAFLADTRTAMPIENGEIVEIEAGAVRVTDTDGNPIERETEEVTWDADAAEKGGYETFMLKEIHEQADAVAETITDRLPGTDGVDLSDVNISDEFLRGVRRIVIVACGTSYHAGLVGRYAIEEWARVPVEVDVASEYRYRNPVVGPEDLVIGMTQSGETADTLAAMRLAREAGATVLAITNIMGSQATRDADAVLYIRAGMEISVAATKTFVAQVAAMYLLGLRIAELRGTLPPERLAELVAEMKTLPSKMEETLAATEGPAKEVAARHSDQDFFLYLGRHIGLPICLEGALKLKEISYIPTDAYAAGEMKHGPIALLDESTPVISVATESPILEKVLSNVEEVRARGAQTIAIATAGDTRVAEVADETIEVAASDWILQPILAILPLQLLAYDIARNRGLNVDQPRNLAKTVTVE